MVDLIYETNLLLGKSFSQTENDFPGGKGFVPSVHFLSRLEPGFTVARAGHSSENRLTDRKTVFLMKKIAIPAGTGFTDRIAALPTF